MPNFPVRSDGETLHWRTKYKGTCAQGAGPPPAVRVENKRRPLQPFGASLCSPEVRPRGRAATFNVTPMKKLLLLPLTCLALQLPLNAAPEPGHIDFGRLTGAARGEYVEINVGRGLLKLASLVAKRNNPEVASIISGLSRIRVNVVELDENNRAEARERITTVRDQLARDGWDQVVTARSHRHEDVVVFVKQGAAEAIEGVVVTVFDDRKREAVFINVVGNIRPDQLEALGAHLHLPALEGRRERREAI